MMHTQHCHRCDVLGLGFGPSNIALAIAHEEQDSPYDMHFLEAQDSVIWQAGMMLDGADIQHNPLRDLVTPCNPRSRYTFVNYLHEIGRLYDFLNLGTPYAFRREYANYIAHVAAQFSDRVTYGARAETVTRSACGNYWQVHTTADTFEARALVVGTGRSANIPAIYKPALGAKVFHMTQYVPRIAALPTDIKRVAVVGASQSAAEIHLDLRARFPHLEVFAIHRSYSMRQKDTSPFSEHLYCPDFTEYFFNAGERGRADLRTQLSPTIYGVSDHDVLHKLYLGIYEDQLLGRQRFHLKNNTDVEAVQVTDTGVALDLKERWTGTHERIKTDAVVLATGFLNIGIGPQHEPCPPVLSGIQTHLLQNDNAVLDVQQNYQVSQLANQPIFLNGLCESTHGFADAGSFSLIAIRAHDIHEQLMQHLQISTTSGKSQ